LVNEVTKLNITSVELCRTALFAAILTIVELASFTCIYPILPPIVAVPFITTFVLAMSIPFVKNQGVLSLIATTLVLLFMGNILPGPLTIPVYGAMFQTRKVKFSGASSAIIHAIYGVFLAPLIFSVAPAKIVYTSFQNFFNSFAIANLVVLILFGVFGAISAGSGYKLGQLIEKQYFRLNDEESTFTK
jgi:hypothetical protein